MIIHKTNKVSLDKKAINYKHFLITANDIVVDV